MTETSPDQLQALATAARDAFRKAGRTTDAERAGWLRAIADKLDSHLDELVEIADRETHLGAARLTGEVARTTGQLRLFADVLEEGSYLEATIDHADPGATPPRPDLRRMLRPIGPVAVFSASNFPFAFSVAGGDTASALAVGCPVIVKAHSGHPQLSRRTAELVGAALESAGAPRGYFALVEGRQAGIDLVQHPLVAAVGFTGSVAGGRALFDLASGRPEPIPFYGELGSINPVVVTEAADAARGSDLAAGLTASFTLGTGQFCTKPGLVFVPADSVLEASMREVSGQRHPLLTPSIAAGFHDRLGQLLEVEGVELIAGESVGAEGEAAPVVLAVDADVAAKRTDEIFAEIFGPATVLVRYSSREQLLGLASTVEGSLTATLHAEPGEQVDELVDVLSERAGRVLFAGWPTGVAVTWSQHHGGPWPSTTSLHTSVGATAVRRFLRPVAMQDAPLELLPAALRDDNPLGIPQRVDGVLRA